MRTGELLRGVREGCLEEESSSVMGRDCQVSSTYEVLRWEGLGKFER